MKRKSFLPVLGTVFVKVRVYFNKRTDVVVGRSTSGNVLRDKNKLFNNAVRDAVTKHLIMGGVLNRKNPNYDLISDYLSGGSLSFDVISYHVDYSASKDLLRIKRVSRRGKYYNYAFDRRSGRIVSVSRFTTKKDDYNI